MPTLGDAFPKPDRRQHISESMKPGAVLYLFCSFTTPAKDKFLALAFMNANRKPFMFIINSGINDFIQRRPHLLSCQVTLLVGDYGFLAHDSYVDCSKVFDHFDYVDIETQLAADIARIKGELTATSRQQIITVVRQARTLSPEQKSLVVGALS